MQYLFVLGARDPEMMTIERLVHGAGQRVAYAMADGRRVTAGNAYRAERISARAGTYSGPIVWVECALADGSLPRDIVVDHHREGDPGFAMPAERYWEGSSLGQTCSLLGIEPDRDLRLAAAADHCLAAAYRGLCPGVDPVDLRAWRLASRAAWQKLSPQVLEERIEAGLARIRQLPTIRIGGHAYADALDSDIPELSEVSAISGIPVMYALREPRGDRLKIGALNGSPEMIRAWMAQAVRVLGLKDVYGCPSRGYAGGYRPLPVSDQPAA